LLPQSTPKKPHGFEEGEFFEKIKTPAEKYHSSPCTSYYIHQTVNHSKTFVSPEGVDTNTIESSWRPLKDHFRKIKIRSVCSECQDKFSVASMLYKDKEKELKERHKNNEETFKELYRNNEEVLKEFCENNDEELKAACEENLRELKSNYKSIRDERVGCPECQEHEQRFGSKLIEYLWRRENKKNGYDAFERLLEAIRHIDERLEAAGEDDRYVFYTND
jgi:hypothetical protein